ncbi:MAG: dCTP deaminase [Methanomassiliicoccales archaeon]|nr:dCTP deaminase [Methanomassiliicoccales archaeon]
MCVIPDHEILEMVKSGRLGIESFSMDSLTPNGYDLRISEISVPGSGDSWNEGVAKIPPQRMFFVGTLEFVRLPDDIAGQLWARTTWIRKGIIVSLGKVDAGFEGNLTFTAFNSSDSHIEIPIGARFVQIVFERMSGPATLAYAKRSGHYQGQRGITLAPIDKNDVSGENAR